MNADSTAGACVGFELVSCPPAQKIPEAIAPDKGRVPAVVPAEGREVTPDERHRSLLPGNNDVTWSRSSAGGRPALFFPAFCRLGHRYIPSTGCCYTVREFKSEPDDVRVFRYEYMEGCA